MSIDYRGHCDEMTFTPYERTEPDWALLRAMIDDLCEREHLISPNGEPSIRKLADRCGLSATALYGLDNHKHKPDAETLLALAKFARQRPLRWLIAGGYLDESYIDTALSAEQEEMLHALADMTQGEQRYCVGLVRSFRDARRRPFDGDAPLP